MSFWSVGFARIAACCRLFGFAAAPTHRPSPHALGHHPRRPHLQRSGRTDRSHLYPVSTVGPVWRCYEHTVFIRRETDAPSDSEASGCLRSFAYDSAALTFAPNVTRPCLPPDEPSPVMSKPERVRITKPRGIQWPPCESPALNAGADSFGRTYRLERRPYRQGILHTQSSTRVLYAVWCL